MSGTACVVHAQGRQWLHLLDRKECRGVGKGHSRSRSLGCSHNLVAFVEWPMHPCTHHDGEVPLHMHDKNKRLVCCAVSVPLNLSSCGCNAAKRAVVQW